MSGHRERFDEALTQIGIQGVTGLVERWADFSRQFRTATLDWDSQMLTYESDLQTWTAKHGPGHFRIDGLPNDSRLYYVWQGWGERALGDGTADVSMTKGGDIIALGANLKDTLARIQAQLPVGMELSEVASQPDAVRRSIDEFVHSLASRCAPTMPCIATLPRRSARCACRIVTSGLSAGTAASRSPVNGQSTLRMRGLTDGKSVPR